MCGGQTGLSGLVISAKSIVETCGCQADDADTVGVAVGDAVGVADLGAIPVDGIVVG